MTDGTLFTGKTVEDAVADGLRSLWLTQEQAEIEIVSRGSRGLFGIGSEPAQVRITPRRSATRAPGAQASAPVPAAPSPDVDGVEPDADRVGGAAPGPGHDEGPELARDSAEQARRHPEQQPLGILDGVLPG